jgi:tetratricopeptide (TPR) repeat protein
MAYSLGLAEEGDAGAAMSELDDILRQRRELFGPESASVSGTLASIGALELELGDPAAAADSYREALRIDEMRFGPDSVRAAGRHLNLGAVYANAHRYEEALDEWQKAERIYASTTGPDDTGARIAASGIALALTRLGRLDEADRRFDVLLARPSPDRMTESLVKQRLGSLRSAQGRHAEAEHLQRDALASMDKSTTDRPRALALAGLGYAQVEAGHAADGLGTLQQARALLARRQKDGSPDLADIDVHSARGRIALGRFDAAIEDAGNAARFWQRLAPSGRDHGIALLWQARALAGRGDTPAATAALADSTRIIATAGLPDDRAQVERAQHDLGLAKR